IFIINGLPGSGKTLFGQMIGEVLTSKGISFLHTSSILPIKHIMLPLDSWSIDIIPKDLWEELYKLRTMVTELDWDGETKDVFWRKVMSEIKVLATSEHPDFLNEWVMSQTDKLVEGSVVFVDIREPE